MRRLLLAAILILALVPGPARADDGDEPSDRAYDLVRQAIALIVNTPGDTMAVQVRIDDAAKAKDPSGVDLPLVRKAGQAFGAGDRHQARALLERSIGARVHTGPAEPVPIGKVPVVGAETGTVAAVDPLPGRGRLTAGDWALLSVSVAVGLMGLALSVRSHRYASGGDRP